MREGGEFQQSLNEEEKEWSLRQLPNSHQENATEIMSELIGYTYTFPREDKRSFLARWKRIFNNAKFLWKNQSFGCWNGSLHGRQKQDSQGRRRNFTDYRKMIREYMNILSNERWRISESETCVMVNGEDIVPETMTGTISSLIAGSPKNAGKIVILRTKGRKEHHQVFIKKII